MRDRITAINGRSSGPDAMKAELERLRVSPAGTPLRLTDGAGRERAITLESYY